MQDKNIRSFYCGMVIALVLVIGGCRTTPVSSTPAEVTETITASPTKTESVRTEKATYISTTTVTPSITPHSTASKVRTPTWTPFATLPPKDAARFARELYTNNAGCKLPCWWGAIPGKTLWSTTDQFLSSFTSRIGQVDTIINPEIGDDYTITNIGFLVKIEGFQQDGYLDYWVVSGIIDEIKVSRSGTELSYQAHQLLSDYGEPQEMWLDVNPYHPLRVPIYTLIVFYPDKGIMAEYQGEAILEGNYYKICPVGSGPELRLYSPDKDLSVQKVYSYDPEFLSYVKPIEEATGMSIQEIFSALSQQQDACIETPVSLWE